MSNLRVFGQRQAVNRVARSDSVKMNYSFFRFALIMLLFMIS